MKIKIHKKFILILTLIVFLLGLLVFLWRMGEPSEGVIYSNVYIHGVAVGGLSKEEAIDALMERFQSELEARIINYTINGETAAEFVFKDFGARFDFDALVEDALDYSHLRSLRRQARRIFTRDFNINAPPIFTFSTEQMETTMQKLSEKIDVPPRNAAFFVELSEGEKISKKDEKAGQGVDTEAAALLTQDVLKTLSNGTVELSIKIIEPQYGSEILNFTPTILGYFETVCFSGQEQPRRRNITRAAERINNSMLYPGEIFSAGAVIAAHLPDSGYESAVVLVRGEPVQDIGGGVCQVVTTLYNAVLRAELEVIQRHNHSARVSYAEPGFDATVAGTYLDLKFKNNTNYPLLITSRVHGERLYVRIYGKDNREAGRNIRFEAREVELIPPEPYREIVDPKIPRGTRIVTLESQIGYNIELYKIVYLHGVETEQIKINSSVYKPLQGIISIGAG